MKTQHLEASRWQRPNPGLANGLAGKKSYPSKSRPSGRPPVAAPKPKLPATALAFPEGLLTTKEIAPRLFIQPRTAALWARQGRIPAYHIGRKLGFKWVEVERALPKTKAEIGKSESGNP